MIAIQHHIQMCITSLHVKGKHVCNQLTVSDNTSKNTSPNHIFRIKQKQANSPTLYGQQLIRVCGVIQRLGVLIIVLKPESIKICQTN